MKIGDVIINEELITVLNELKSQLSANGVHLFADIKDSGNNIMVTCPYHKNGQERRPSAGILKTDGTFHCFTCGETHSLNEVISHCFGRDDGGLFGMKWLLKNFVSVSTEERRPYDLNFNRNIVTNDDVEYVSEEELDTYRYTHPYWAKRGITNENLIELFDLGYDINTDCITFPVKDTSGNCLFVARRSVNTKYFNYPMGARKPIYGAYELSKLSQYPKEVIICESMLDALTAWQYGKYAVALNGLGSSSQYEELSRMPCRRFILATDNDEAGLTARKRLRAHIRNHLVTEYQLPQGKKDLNELTEEEFKNLKEIF